MAQKKWTKRELQKLKRLVKKKLPWGEIAKEFADRTIKSLQLKAWRKRYVNREHFKLDIDRAIKLRKEGMTYKQIGEELGYTGSAVWNALERSTCLVRVRRRRRKGAR